MLYLFLVGTTVYFVSIETKLRLALHDTESAITALESEYYGAIARINSENPAAFGLVAPDRVEYVAAAPRGAISRAGN